MAKPHYRENVSLKDKAKLGRFLAEGEEIVLVTGLSGAFLRRIFIFALGFPGLIFILGGALYGYAKGDSQLAGYAMLGGLLIAMASAFLRMVLANKAHRYVLTTRRVLIKKGFFSVDLQSALYDKITHIEVVQSFFDRVMFHHGKIIINTAGMNKNEIILPFVDYPIEFKNVLERLINREREQVGKQTGPVQTLEGEIVD